MGQRVYEGNRGSKQVGPGNTDAGRAISTPAGGDELVDLTGRLIEAANSVCERSGKKPELLVLRRLSSS